MLQKFFWIFLLFTSCATGSSYDVVTTDKPIVALPAPSSIEEDVPNEKRCVPDKFYNGQIPYGYQLDADCPPVIYDPPRNVPPWELVQDSK